MAHHHTSPTLVIGYGNTLRSDDGVGPAIAQAVSEWENPHIRTIICHQLTPELADPIAAADLVIFVDAIAHIGDSHPEIVVQSLSPNLLSSGAEMTPNWMAHRCHPTTLLSLAQWLYHHAPKAWLVAIPAVSFAMGCEFSETAIQQMQTALKIIEVIVQHSEQLDAKLSDSCTCYTTPQSVFDLLPNATLSTELATSSKVFSYTP